MQFEHFALNVKQPHEMADWYVQHCGMKIVLALDEPPHTRFLADDTGRVVFEVYRNEAAPLPDWPVQHPLNFHHALMVADPDAERDRLVAAGATLFEEVRPSEGTHLVMLRDPWGVPLQLCKRSRPLV